MSVAQILILVLLTLFAIYRQSIRHEVVGRTRFKLAIIYAVVAVATTGSGLPPDERAWVAFTLSILLSLLVGIARSRLTRLTLETDGKIYSQGTPATIGLFILLVVGKFAWGTWEYLHNNHPDGGFSEVLWMIAAMVAIQAQIVWSRAKSLRRQHTSERQ